MKTTTPVKYKCELPVADMHSAYSTLNLTLEPSQVANLLGSQTFSSVDFTDFLGSYCWVDGITTSVAPDELTAKTKSLIDSCSAHVSNITATSALTSFNEVCRQLFVTGALTDTVHNIGRSNASSFSALKSAIHARFALDIYIHQGIASGLVSPQNTVELAKDCAADLIVNAASLSPSEVAAAFSSHPEPPAASE